MKCNICNSGDMKHDVVLYDKLKGVAKRYSKVSKKYHKAMNAVMKGDAEYKGRHITHIYNCCECPNSQLEYYDQDDAIAYCLAMK